MKRKYMSRLLGLQTIGIIWTKIHCCAKLCIISSTISGRPTSLLNISLKSIEMARYRLRKKPEIEHEQNLTAFLMSI